jgi:hypothetical protein
MTAFIRDAAALISVTIFIASIAVMAQAANLLLG